MKAVVINGKEDLAIVDAPTPEPGGEQVRLRSAYAGICGSDLHYYFEGASGEFVLREPLTPGHEVAGTVDLDPTGELAPGTPVTVHPATAGTPLPGLEGQPHLWPGGAYLGSASTWPHTQGGMAEYLVVDRRMVRVLPDGLPVRRAALAEPLGVALHAVAVAGELTGRRVLVCGAGPVGLLAVAGAVAAGAGEVVVTDVQPGPLSRARAAGAHQTVEVDEEQVPAESCDVVLECSGSPAAISAGLVAAKRAGTFVQVGIVGNRPVGVNLAPMISKELVVKGSWRFNTEIDDALALLAANPGIEDAVITHEISADEAVKAFTTAKDSQASGKVLVSLWPDS